jgi:hypothetical protein
MAAPVADMPALQAEMNGPFFAAVALVISLSYTHDRPQPLSWRSG